MPSIAAIGNRPPPMFRAAPPKVAPRKPLITL
jgi:hypothetical protein